MPDAVDSAAHSVADPRHLLIPFAGRSSPECRAALPALALPQLQALLQRLQPAARDEAGIDTLSPPHERALAAALGWPPRDGCLPWAARQAAHLRLPGSAPGAAGTQAWAWVTLAHWDVAIDEVVLGDPASVAIEAAESQALLHAARPFFDEDGIVLHETPAPGRWLARSELFRDLPSASLDRAIGQPISAWLAGIDAQRTLRRLANEMQMLLYTQRVNDERSARGQPSINSFWLSGTGLLPAQTPAEPALPTVDDTLRQAALADDGPAWAAAWAALDAGPLAALREAQWRGEAVTLTLCGDRAAQRFETPPRRGPGQWFKSLFDRQRPSALLEKL